MMPIVMREFISQSQHFEEESADECTPIVKNTFLVFSEVEPAMGSKRCNSVPASSRLCNGNDGSRKDSEVSADTCSTNTEESRSEDERSISSDEIPAWKRDGTALCMRCEDSPADDIALFPSPPEVIPFKETQAQLTSKKQSRLNSKATVFVPKSSTGPPGRRDSKQNCEDVLRTAMNAIWASGQAASVELSGGMDGWSITIKAANGDSQLTESLLTVAKDAILQASSQNKSIYVLGYCSPKPFVTKPQGFSGSLCIMESPTIACWHLYKKGFCRHADDCCKQHPSVQVPLQVVVETSMFNASASSVHDFKEQVSSLAMSVSAALSGCEHIWRTEVVRDMSTESWSIEITTKDEHMLHKEEILATAKHALSAISNMSKNMYILGYAASPSVAKSSGFLTLVGNMKDETKACWVLYSKGVCSRDGSCRWQHPSCVMPLNIVVKPAHQAAWQFMPIANNYSVPEFVHPDCYAR